MSNQFEAVMAKRTDAELLSVINSPVGDYQPLAVEAAKREFEKRNLSNDQISAAKTEIKQKEQNLETKANEPLNIVAKIFAFLFPGFLMLLFAVTYKADGYIRKYRESVRWTLYGLCFYIAFIVITGLWVYFQ
ncbi:hypothetical protein [Mucilaginibacter panaciglaebae]|uniref:Uncharacterized protein n=1 Tax=Mucilaginibacter panaciglaebae TaxID=502331 RepID=A0ABP7X5Q1_9SPHI